MGAIPIPPRTPAQSHMEPPRKGSASPNWVRYGAAGSLLAGGILLLTGKGRAGLVASATGAALAMLDEKDLVKQWWEALPGYLDSAQRMLDQAQQTIDDLATKRDRIMSILGKSA
jgi:hypothetical protein